MFYEKNGYEKGTNTRMNLQCELYLAYFERFFTGFNI